ncbi:MAG: FkbM family methyltransferase [Pirellulales bacterium]
MIEVLAFRMLGYRHTRLSTNNPTHAKHIADVSGSLVTKRKAQKCDQLDGWIDEFAIPNSTTNIRLQAHKLHVLHTFLAEQYRYKSDIKEVGVQPGDIVVDGGGCWGDTALYFANTCGPNGQIHVFEFSQANISLLNENVRSNPHLQSRIFLQERALWDESDLQISFSENGPSTQAIINSTEGSNTGVTLSIDDWHKRSKLERVDFIKLDVEGAEERCLLGAKNTIARFRPRLAVAVYHSLRDFVALPKLVDQFNPDYKMYLGHYTIQLEETILFAE